MAKGAYGLEILIEGCVRKRLCGKFGFVLAIIEIISETVKGRMVGVI